MSGKLIRLFLVDGNPNGLRTVEISNIGTYYSCHKNIGKKTRILPMFI